jgi:MFS family permease
VSTFFYFVSKKHNELLIVAFICVVYFFSYFYRLAIPGICFDELQKSFGAPAGAIVALGSIFFYIYGLMQPFVGALVDRFGGKNILIIGGALMGVGGIVFPCTDSLKILYVSRAVTAFGASCIFLGLVKEIDTLFDASHFAIMLGLALFAGYSGGLAGTLPFAGAIRLFGWRKSLFFVGVLSIIAVVAASIFFIKSKKTEKKARIYRNYIWLVLKNKKSYPLFLCASINFSIYFLMQSSIGKKMFTDLTEISASKATFFIFIMMLTCIIVTTCSAFVSKMLGNRRKPILVSFSLLNCVAILALVINLLIKPSAYFIATCFMLFAIVGAGSPVSGALIKEINPPSAAGTSVGLYNASAYLVAAIITNVAGIILDCFKDHAFITNEAIKYPSSAYVLIAILAFAVAMMGLIASLFLCETRGENIYKSGK